MMEYRENMGRLKKGFLVIAVAATTGVSGCGNYTPVMDIQGLTGVSKSDDGTVQLMIETCSLTLNRIVVSEGREGIEGNEPNPRLGEISPLRNKTGFLEVNLDSIGSDWEGSDRILLPDDDELFIVSPEVSEKNSAIPQVSATQAALERLRPGEVIIHNGEKAAVEEFSTACD
ncbi:MULTISPECIES: hypothetical protein [Corynebacterium]|nr:MULTISPECIES: hypothetical protein [Corynebacterium]QJS17367.1 hypothetical protein HK412_14705 [Corynebacterium glutamicum]QXU45884.1 hypothetical protein KW808_00625 [[Brevibacterium] flavum]